MNIHPLAMVGISAAAPLAVGIAIPQEHATTVGLLVVTSVTIAGLIAWIDARIAKQIKDHSAQDILRHEAVLAELRHLRERSDMAAQHDLRYEGAAK